MSTETVISIHPDRNGDARVYVTATGTEVGRGEAVLIYGGLSIQPSLFKRRTVSLEEAMKKNAQRLQHGYQQFCLQRSSNGDPGASLLLQVRGLARWFQQAGNGRPVDLFGPACIDQAEATLKASKHFRCGDFRVAVTSFELPAYPSLTATIW